MPENVIHLHPAPPSEPARPPRRARAARGLKPGWNRWVGVRGGEVFVAKDGTLSFYVSRMIAGARSRVNLHTHDAESAIVRLREWEKNPAGWNPLGSAPAEPVLLTAELVAAYVAWCAEVPPGKVRRRNTDAAWIAKKRNYLAWWGEQLHGRNLRSDGSAGCVTTDDLKAILASEPRGYRHRLETIKALYGYLRTEAGGVLRVQRHHDPSDAIPVPKPDAAQAREGGSKVAWTKADSDKVIRWLEKHVPERRRTTGRETFNVEQAAAYLGLTVATVRAFAARRKLHAQGGGHGVPLVFSRKALDAYDRRRAESANTARRVALALRVLGGTGWHVSEVVRFSRHGTIEELPPDHVRQHGAAKVLTCLHKGGFVHPSPVTEKVAAAAAELQRLGGISVDPIFKWTARAIRETGAAPFKPGRYRHRTGTFQINQGATKGAVSKGLGHKSTATTGIYTLRAVAPKLQTWY
jgi:integrase